MKEQFANFETSLKLKKLGIFAKSLMVEIHSSQTFRKKGIKLRQTKT